ncbi:MAG: alpha/beta hydrolase [Chitinophagaceae bacterium]
MKAALRSFYFVICVVVHTAAFSQVTYPYPVKRLMLVMDNTFAEMAYMDIQPASTNGHTIVLLHGKNFNGYYWKEVIPYFVEAGYRVIVPDQVGWGRSDKPELHYSFHLLAQNTACLLDTLGVNKVIFVGHSMGGMLATRFAILYPQRVEKLILENPIGLEDYKRFVPYQSTESLTAKEKLANYDSYKKYQQSYYPEWKPEYEQYVEAQAEALKDPNFVRIAKVNALTYQMIYQEPVCYEWDRLTMPVLLIIGLADRTVVGKEALSEEQKKKFGQYPVLGKKTKAQIRNSRLIELPGVGHIPHIQQSSSFIKAVLGFLG